MNGIALAGILATVIAVGVLLAGHLAGPRGRQVQALAKTAASAGFLVAAWGFGAFADGWGVWIGVGLVLSFAGDVLLIPSGTGRVFLAGVVAFLLAHVAYVTGFAIRGLDPMWTVLVLAVLMVPRRLLLARILPDEGRMRVAVPIYAAVLSVMLAFAVGSAVAHPAPVLAAGALAFYLSDISVALDRFGPPGGRHKLWGLPLYYLAQLLLAASTAA